MRVAAGASRRFLPVSCLAAARFEGFIRSLQLNSRYVSGDSLCSDAEGDGVAMRRLLDLAGISRIVRVWDTEP